jgi:hypothetical protein
VVVVVVFQLHPPHLLAVLVAVLLCGTIQLVVRLVHLVKETKVVVVQLELLMLEAEAEGQLGLEELAFQIVLAVLVVLVQQTLFLAHL